MKPSLEFKACNDSVRRSPGFGDDLFACRVSREKQEEACRVMDRPPPFIPSVAMALAYSLTPITCANIG